MAALGGDALRICCSRLIWNGYAEEAGRLEQGEKFRPAEEVGGTATGAKAAGGQTNGWWSVLGAEVVGDAFES